MSKINTVTVTLNVYNPVLKELQSGKGDSGVAFSASHQYAWQDAKKNKADPSEWLNHTEWYNITTFDAKTIEYIRQNIKKGSDILVSGTQTVKTYQAEDGSTRYDRSLRLSHISFIIPRQKSNLSPTNQTQQNKASVPDAEGRVAENDMSNADDIPF